MIYLALALIPYAFVLSGQLHTGHHFGLLTIAMLIVVRTINDRALQLFFYYLAIQCIFIFSGTLFGVTTIDQSFRALNYLLHCTAGLVFLAAVVNCKIDSNKIYNIICVSAIIQCVVCLGQYYLSFDPFLYVLSNWVSINHEFAINTSMPGTLGNRNFVAGFIAISVPFFMRGNWKFFIPLILVVLFLATTSTAIIALAVGAVVYSRNFYIICASLSAGIAYACFYDNVIGNVRFDNWVQVAKQLSETPTRIWFGLGPNAAWAKNHLIHNDLFNVLFYHGTIGLAVAIVFFIKLINSDKILLTAVSIAIVNSMGSYSMHIAPVAMLNITIIGLIIKKRTAQ